MIDADEMTGTVSFTAVLDQKSAAVVRNVRNNQFPVRVEEQLWTLQIVCPKQSVVIEQPVYLRQFWFSKL